MVKRTVTFTAQADGGVTPAIPLFGGVKGEHNATELAITLESGMYTAGEAVRLSFTTGDGTVLSSDLIGSEELDVAQDGTATIRYPLPQLLTVAAGQLCVRVVLSQAETDTWRSGEMVLYFEHADIENGTPFWTGVSEMLSRTVAAKDEAVTASRSAEEVCVAAVDLCLDASASASKAHNAAKEAAASAETAASAEMLARETAELVKGMYEKLNAVLEYKGTVTTLSEISNKAVGDVWFVASKQSLYLWNGEHWRAFGAGGSGGSYTLTDADKEVIVNDVLAALPSAEGVAF